MYTVNIYPKNRIKSYLLGGFMKINEDSEKIKAPKISGLLMYEVIFKRLYI